MVFARLIPAIAANAVIIAGFFGDGWSPGTVLALYWLQTVITIPLTAILMALHRRQTRKLGYYQLERSAADGKIVAKSSAFRAGFLLSSTIFALAHGVFLAVILFWMLNKGSSAMNVADVRKGLAMLAIILFVTFLADLAQLRSRPFAWIRQRSEALMRRVIVMHFVIIFGMVAAAFMTNESAGFFGVFIALKLLADVASELPAWDPKEAPRWLVWLGKHGAKGEVDMTAEWQRIRKEQREGFAQAERTLDEVLAERAP